MRRPFIRVQGDFRARETVTPRRLLDRGRATPTRHAENVGPPRVGTPRSWAEKHPISRVLAQAGSRRRDISLEKCPKVGDRHFYIQIHDFIESNMAVARTSECFSIYKNLRVMTKMFALSHHHVKSRLSGRKRRSLDMDGNCEEKLRTSDKGWSSKWGVKNLSR
ncbi:hypothetical protein L798_02598 [Zootermopsis nevadensis]|uniref:Uncharacterized protein n=1 Tax=Zootermopsis nevadensis TaxID=136037 RepID=A0A067QTJ0_ZOONE|nr:hypothetical protein L798_02598 [Zootermopsis nevadensis]